MATTMPEVASQDDSSVSEVEAFCSNEECRDPIVMVDDDGYTCHGCDEIFCQSCITFLAEDLHLELYLLDEDGFCPQCADATRQELDPNTETGKWALAENAKMQAEMDKLKKKNQRPRRPKDHTTSYRSAPYTPPVVTRKK
jgi:hypothetical protein